MLLLPTNSPPCVLFGESNVVALTDLSPRGPGYVTRGVDVFMKDVRPPRAANLQTPPQLTDSSSCRDDWDPLRGPRLIAFPQIRAEPRLKAGNGRKGNLRRGGQRRAHLRRA